MEVYFDNCNCNCCEGDKKKGDSPCSGKTPLSVIVKLAYYGNVNRSRTFLALLDIECNLFAFVEGFESA